MSNELSAEDKALAEAYEMLRAIDAFHEQMLESHKANADIVATVARRTEMLTYSIGGIALGVLVFSLYSLFH